MKEPDKTNMTWPVPGKDARLPKLPERRKRWVGAHFGAQPQGRYPKQEPAPAAWEKLTDHV